MSFYLMCVYSADASRGMSPALTRWMQGKACFNFKTVDDELFGELRALTRSGYEGWKKLKWVD